MSKQLRPRLIVTTEDNRSFIHVPTGYATELHQFLRSKGMLTSPPEPLWSGTDCIQLGRGSNTPAIQKLLDGWA